MYIFPEPINTLHSIYSPEIPDFLMPFIQAPEMQRLGGVTQTCGLTFTQLYTHQFFLSRLDHSVGVALIIRHFTHNIKQTLAGLFHDISHTAFSHVGDFLRGDHENQESSEIFHDDIIRNSRVISEELDNLGIAFEDIHDYTKYPIADNDLPRLAADRLEYNFCEIVAFSGDLDKVKKLYQDIVVLTNEDGLDELGFQNQDIASDFAQLALDNDIDRFSSYESKLGMSFLTDLLKDAFALKLFTLDDLYRLTDLQVFEKIEQSKNPVLMKKLLYFRNMKKYVVHQQKPDINQYTVDTTIKRRYIDPLVKTLSGNQRVSQLDPSFAQKFTSHKNKPLERISCDWTE